MDPINNPSIDSVILNMDGAMEIRHSRARTPTNGPPAAGAQSPNFLSSPIFDPHQARARTLMRLRAEGRPQRPEPVTSPTSPRAFRATRPSWDSLTAAQVATRSMIAAIGTSRPAPAPPHNSQYRFSPYAGPRNRDTARWVSEQQAIHRAIRGETGDAAAAADAQYEDLDSRLRQPTPPHLRQTGPTHTLVETDRQPWQFLDVPAGPIRAGSSEMAQGAGVSAVGQVGENEDVEMAAASSNMSVNEDTERVKPRVYRLAIR